MNKAYLLTLACDNLQTVAVTFDLEADITSKYLKTYTYLTVLSDLNPGDDVIVDTPDGLKIAQVAGVHDEPDVDPDAKYEYKWAISKKGVGAMAELTRLKNLADDAVATIRKAQKAAQRKKVREQLLYSLGGDDKSIKSIELK